MKRHIRLLTHATHRAADTNSPWLCPSSESYAQLPHFGYTIDTRQQRITHEHGMAQYLGYHALQCNLPSKHLYLLHPDERAAVAALRQGICAFVKAHGAGAMDCVFVAAHRLRCADGTYLSVLRHIMPKVLDSQHNLTSYACACTDLTPHAPLRCSVTLDVRLPPHLVELAPSLDEHFQSLMPVPPLRLAPHELAALRAWLATSANLSPALSDQMSALRQRLGLRRNADVAALGKARGWV